ncbi:MAG: hypothetical protein ICV73_18780 [Acetobacteraceae bacterium]|nr:hypothetical protein [Acetobacteraceae bacterium]
MKVYVDEGGERRLVGRAELPEDCGPVYEVLLFGGASTIAEVFTVGAVTRLPEGGGAPAVERAVLAVPGQLVELLPGWVPLRPDVSSKRAFPYGTAHPRERLDVVQAQALRSCARLRQRCAG